MQTQQSKKIIPAEIVEKVSALTPVGVEELRVATAPKGVLLTMLNEAVNNRAQHYILRVPTETQTGAFVEPEIVGIAAAQNKGELRGLLMALDLINLLHAATVPAAKEEGNVTPDFGVATDKQEGAN